MADFSLTAQKRDITGKKVGRLRRDGIVPGTIYGPKIDPISVKFVYRTLEIALMKAGGTNVIDLTVEGGSTYPVLARHVQRDVLRGEILHVDFFALDMDTTIRTEVPIVYINESPIVAARQGIMITGPHMLSIETLPSNLLHEIQVDISSLTEIGDTIEVRDLKLGDKVEILNDPEEMLVKILQPSSARAAEAGTEEEEEAMDEGEMPELIRDSEEEEE